MEDGVLGAPRGVILRVSMDGTNAAPLVQNLTKPTGVHIDHEGLPPPTACVSHLYLCVHLDIYIYHNNNNNNNNKYLLEESFTFFSYKVYKLIILLFPLKGFR